MTLHTDHSPRPVPEIVAQEPDGSWSWQPLHRVLTASHPAWLPLNFSLAAIHPARLPELLNHYRKAAISLTADNGNADSETPVSAVPAPKRKHPPHIETAIRQIGGHAQIKLEIIGTWLWAQDKYEQHGDELRAAGFRFSPRKSRWYLRPPKSKRSLTAGTVPIDDLRNTYGTTTPQ